MSNDRQNINASSSPTSEDGANKTAEPKKKEKGLARKIYEALPLDTRLFHAPDRTPFARYQVGKHYETHRIGSLAMRSWLTHLAHTNFSTPPGRTVIDTVIALLESKARHEGPEEQVYCRVANL